MKPGCRIVNCARGGIVNEADLAEALKAGAIAGAALDVYTSEPFENNPFIGLDNIVMTPHLAASTDEAQLTVAVEVAAQMADFLTSGAIVNAVNVPSLDSETPRAAAPGTRKRAVPGACGKGPDAIEIEYSARSAWPSVRPASIPGISQPAVEGHQRHQRPAPLRTRDRVAEKRPRFRLRLRNRRTIVTAEGPHDRGTLFDGSIPGL